MVRWACVKTGMHLRHEILGNCPILNPVAELLLSLLLFLACELRRKQLDLNTHPPVREIKCQLDLRKQQCKPKFGETSHHLTVYQNVHHTVWTDCTFSVNTCLQRRVHPWLYWAPLLSDWEWNRRGRFYSRYWGVLSFFKITSCIRKMWCKNFFK